MQVLVHELHLYRQDTDYFLMTMAIRYGVTVLQHTGVKDVEINSAGVRVIAESGNCYEAEYVVDARGFGSLSSHTSHTPHTPHTAVSTKKMP